MKWIDIHAHSFISDPAILRICSIVSPELIPNQIEIPGNYSIGIHPRYINASDPLKDFQIIEKYSTHKNVPAIGESGLDHLSTTPIEIQKKVFMEMIKLSEQRAKPLILHCVKAHAEIIQLHQSIQPKQSWIFHGFNQRKTISDLLLKENILLSFGAAILNEKNPAADLIKQMKPGTFFLETDESEISIQSIYEKAGELIGCSLAELTASIHQLYEHTFHHD